MPFSSQRGQSQSQESITERLSMLGVLAACVFAIAIPSVYLTVSIIGTQRALAVEAAFFVKGISRIIQDRPDLWEYESIRLKELMSQPLPRVKVHEREILNVAGKVVTKTDFIETRPFISVSMPFFDSGRLVGSIIVKHSIRTEVITTILLGILSSLIGYLSYFIFRTYPIRRLEQTLTDLRLERDKSDKTLYAIDDGVITVDHEGKILFINRVAESLVGMDASEAVGRPLEEVYVLRQEREDQLGKRGRVLTGKGGNEYFIEEVRTPLNEMGGSGAVVTFRDITERRQSEEMIRQMVYHDTLTGLPNRKLFSDRLGIALAQAQRNQKEVGIAMLDLDNFKEVNDTLGHDVGDLFLKATAERLSAELRKGDTVARFGGDEFLLILPDLEIMEDVIQVAQKIVDSFHKPLLIDTHQLVVTTSIGIAVYPHDGIEEGILLKKADIAMYKAKQAGGGRYQLYNELCKED